MNEQIYMVNINHAYLHIKYAELIFFNPVCTIKTSLMPSALELCLPAQITLHRLQSRGKK